MEDISLKSEDVQNWLLILKSFGDQTGLSASEMRTAFTYAIKNGLEKVIRRPLYEDTGEPLASFIKRKAHLPVREQSPLFSYSLDELRDPSKVPNCELIQLVSWVTSVRAMLGIVYGGAIPVFHKGKFPSKCPAMHGIPYVEGDPIPKSFPSPEMRFNHQFQKANIYWVPSQYMP